MLVANPELLGDLRAGHPLGIQVANLLAGGLEGVKFRIAVQNSGGGLDKGVECHDKLLVFPEIGTQTGSRGACAVGKNDDVIFHVIIIGGESNFLTPQMEYKRIPLMGWYICTGGAVILFDGISQVSGWTGAPQKM